MTQQRAHRLAFAILLLWHIPICLAAETSDPTDPNRYLNAVRTFSDNVLKYGRDAYGPKHTPSTACPSLGRPIWKLQRA